MKALKALTNRVAQWCVDTYRKAGVRQWLLAALVYVALAGLLLANVVTEPIELEVGQVARRNIEAPFRAVDRYRTDLLRAAEADRAVTEAVADASNYVINQAVAVRGRERIAQAFRLLADARAAAPFAARPGDAALPGDGSAAAAPVPGPDALPVDPVRVRQSLLSATGIDLPLPMVEAALGLDGARLMQLQELAGQVAGEILLGERIEEERLEPLRAELEARLRETPAYSRILAGEEEVALVAALVGRVLEPNLVIDLQRLNRAKEAAMQEVKPVYVERGQIIVRQGDLVTEEDIRVLQDLGLLGNRANYASALGVLLVLALMMALFGVYLYQYRRHVLLDEGHLALLGLILVVVAGVIKALSFFPSEASGYLAPIALATILIAILLDSHVAMMTAVFLSVIVGIAMGLELKFTAIALVSGIAGVLSVRRVGERSDLTRAGLLVGVATVVAMVAFGFLRSEAFMIKYSFLGFVNGLASAVGAIGLFPYLESVFGITSSIRLLELSNPNQPLLRKLLMDAPGSYHHSMIVGNLAEAAVEAIGGDSLLTRVGAQYHDIGKTKRPYFFIENQYGGENPHDKISPYLSTLIITSHVKDGVELARKHKLPECVIDFIRQHHGTTLVKYFYHKALENAKDGECSEKDFRYPGPRPQSKETAVVLLADSVEAAVRTLSRPTPGRIEGLVRKIIKDHLADGQLDESNITLRDLDKVAEVFVKVLTGIFHQRIDYPESVIKEMEAKRA